MKNEDAAQSRPVPSNRRISPVPQSIGPSAMAAARRCSCGITFGCTVKPSGGVT